MISRKAISLVIAPLFCSNAYADWSGGLEAGTQLGSGNSPALRLYLSNQAVPLAHYVYLDWIRESGGSRYRLGYDPTYTISQSIFSFGQFSIEQDDPGGIERELDARVGIGNNVYRTPNNQLTFKAGLGGTQITFADNSDETDGYLFAGGLFTSKLIGLLRFDAIVESRVADTQIWSTAEAGVSLRVGPNTALKFAYTVEHYDFDSDREDIRNEDSFVTLTYGF